MASNEKDKPSSKYSFKKTDSEKMARYSKSSYFQEKDRKAIEFLKKHPVPAKLLKSKRIICGRRQTPCYRSLELLNKKVSIS